MNVLTGLQTQITVIHALVLRETRTRFGENRLGYIWAFFEPIGVIVTFFFALRYGGQPAPAGMDYVTFLATGLLTYELVFSTSERVAESIHGNRALLYYPQVHRLDLVFARALLEAATLMSVFFVIMAADMLYTRDYAIDDPLGVLLGLIAASVFGTATGMVFCMLGVVTTFVDRIRATVLRPLFWISGIFYTANELPVDLRRIALYNPILHIIELVRDAWSQEYVSHDASAAYVIGWILVLFTAGLLLEQLVRRKVDLG
jgi:capsular polysaccharide transport system permease protein